MIIMRLLINKKDLALLLEQKRDYIGNRVAVDTVIAGISFLLSAFTASYNDIFFASSITLKYLFCFISVLYTLKIAKDLIEMHSDSYNHTKLMKDIEDLDMIQHKHSLIVIKRNKNQKASKSLPQCQVMNSKKTSTIQRKTSFMVSAYFVFDSFNRLLL